MLYTWETQESHDGNTQVIITSPLVNDKAWRLHGTLNGIQAEYYNPKAANFSALTLTQQFLERNGIKQLKAEQIQQCASLAHKQILNLARKK
ncbi:hypothetical protein [Piscirickettsia litoralis]|uniref:Uncharacterized protein n=1 Tax=Piscirickettsia litoralis TaxID=1891921 RepID=A0ABX2ZZQ2_9GAMM|nr:hypothetical protein [Piscirickettsia litoralis]ODN41983.1 hypothetical protein BGC07_02185 [Piscirickettsia litoralis]